MEGFVKGDIVVILFPFSDFSEAKKRPALVVAQPTSEDFILTAITSRKREDAYAIVIDDFQLKEGSLKKKSTIRSNKLITLHSSLIDYKVAKVNRDVISQVEDKIIRMITQ